MSFEFVFCYILKKLYLPLDCSTFSNLGKRVDTEFAEAFVIAKLHPLPES